MLLVFGSLEYLESFFEFTLVDVVALESELGFGRVKFVVDADAQVG